MKRVIGLVSGLIVSLSLANAQIWTFDTLMNGSNVNPPNDSPATGRAFGTYNQATNVLQITMQASGFESDTFAGDIHRAPAGQNGPLVFRWTNQSGNPRIWFSENTFNLTEEQEADFLAGLWYVDIHTNNFQRGEIRGQLNPVPEPGSLLALTAGALGFWFRRRRS